MAAQLVEAAKNLLEACYQADARGELDDAVTGELMMAVRDALIAAPTAAQLSQAVEAATAPLHRIIQMQNAERIAINEENQRNYNDLVARQETIVEAAQGAILEAAAAAARGALRGGFVTDYVQGRLDAMSDVNDLQTEPMAAALAARDKRIRDDAEEQLYRELESAVRHSLLITGDVERAKTILSDAFTRCRRAARKETP